MGQARNSCGSHGLHIGHLECAADIGIILAMTKTGPIGSRKIARVFAVAAFITGASLIGVNFYDRVAWRAQRTYVNVLHALIPELNTVPTPQTVSTLQPGVLTQVSIPAAVPTMDKTTFAATAPTTIVVTPIPGDFQLTGFTHIWQKLNNCGPATLAMNLNYWGWKGTQANTAAALKPDPNDRNVSPEELAAYAKSVGLGAVVRVGGSLPLIKQFVAAGFPVIVEKSIILEDAGWSGHYALVTGYAEATQNFTTQDSLQGPNFQAPYSVIANSWRAFNYTYIVIYPPQREAEVNAILGADADRPTDYTHAANIARQEIASLSGQELAFAWFNLGSSLNAMGDSLNAASAFDQARVAQLPWRIVWYQFGPFEAYYNAGRYSDVIALADSTLAQANNLEEVYYWRGRAYLATDRQDQAIADWQTALRYNRNYQAPTQALAQLGISP